MRFTTPGTSHEGGAGTLLALASLIGALSEDVMVIGVEPEVVRTGIGLSPAVERGMAQAIEDARREIDARSGGCACGSLAQASAIG